MKVEMQCNECSWCRELEIKSRKTAPDFLLTAWMHAFEHVKETTPHVVTVRLDGELSGRVAVIPRRVIGGNQWMSMN